MADALLVCEDKKTLAALQRQFVEAPAPSNMADFLRISPWQANQVRAALRAHQVAWLIAEGERPGAPKVISINIADSPGEKDKDTRHLEPADWFFDYSEGTYKNGFLLRGLYDAGRAQRGHLRFAALSAGKDEASVQPPPAQRTAPSLSQQVPHCPPNSGRPGLSLAPGME
jgi:hypothetical protein